MSEPSAAWHCGSGGGATGGRTSRDNAKWRCAVRKCDAESLLHALDAARVATVRAGACHSTAVTRVVLVRTEKASQLPKEAISLLKDQIGW